jgi:hypothetical protein
LPAYSPDFNPDEAIWDWAREEVTANTCFGTKAKVRAKLDPFFAALAERTAEVKQRCRTILQSQADALVATADQFFAQVPMWISLWPQFSPAVTLGTGRVRHDQDRLT